MRSTRYNYDDDRFQLHGSIYNFYCQLNYHLQICTFFALETDWFGFVKCKNISLKNHYKFLI